VLQDLATFDDHVEQLDNVRSPGSFAGMKTVANGLKDYHLTRTLFHSMMLGNLKVMRVLRDTPEEELRHRLEALRARFGSARLGRTDFHVWIMELTNTTHLTRVESDIIFDAFDDNRSGGVDDEEFVQGLQSVLYDQDRVLVMFTRKLLGDVRATIGTVMSEGEVNALLSAIGNLARRKFPHIDTAIEVAARNIGEFTQQSQVPTTEFCRALQVSPLISVVFNSLNDDGTFPKSPTPPPTPDPIRDIPRLAKVEAEAEEALKAADRELQDAVLQQLTSSASLTIEASLAGPPKRKPKPPPPPSVLSVLDVAHPGFRADESIDQRRCLAEVQEHDRPKWYTRGGIVWCKTRSQGEFMV
jgi:hypothetical protein